MKQKGYLFLLITLFLFFEIIYSTAKNLKSKKSTKSKNKKTENKTKKSENLNKNKKKQYIHSPNYTAYCKIFF